MSQIINSKGLISGDTALRLGHWFNIEPQFWMNLQAQFDLLSADRNAGNEIKALPTAAAIAQKKLEVVHPEQFYFQAYAPARR